MADRFKLDENIPWDAANFLERAGYDVETVLSEAVGGSADAIIFDACQAEGRLLVTLDLDFAGLRQYPPQSHNGIRVPRPSLNTVAGILALIEGAIGPLGSEPTMNRLWIIESGRVRIHD